MDKTRKITIILTLAVAFCFVLVSLVKADPNDPVTKGWANRNLVNKNRAAKIPIWQITREGTSKSVDWVDHTSNPRFAIYDHGTPEDNSDDLVLDKETGLIWARNAYLTGTTLTWGDALNYCRGLTLGDRMGWRLPTVEELSSLVDPSRTAPALPTGHPFINVMYHYWSSSTHGTI